MVRSVGALGTIGQDPLTIALSTRANSTSTYQIQKSRTLICWIRFFKIVAFNGDDKVYQKLDTLWRTAKTPEERVRSISGFAVF